MTAEAPRSRVVIVCINGIKASPGASDGWTDRAVTWLHLNTSWVAEKWEYAAGALTRRFRQQERAEKIATLLHYYEEAGFSAVLVGHSNGCDIIARVLDLRGREPWYFCRPLRSAHLFAAAADWKDFECALAHDSVGRVHLYGSENDRALKLAQTSRRLVGWLGLGYGSLGLEGDAIARTDHAARRHAAQRVFDHSNDSFGHDTWFARGERFESTMRDLHSNEILHS